MSLVQLICVGNITTDQTNYLNTEHILHKVQTHIKSFPSRSSHYSRHDNNNIRYLPSELSVSKMYKLYLELYEPTVYAQFQRGEKGKHVVKYKYYNKYFNNNFNLAIGYSRSDTCQSCDKYKVIIDAEKNLEVKHQLELEKEIHIRKAEVIYSDMKTCRIEAKEHNEVELITFDYQQNMPLPHVPCGDVFYKRQLWSYNFCIYSGKTGQSFHFMYDETIAKKSQNEVTSFLHYYFKHLLKPDIKTIYIFTDNCSA